MLFAYSVNSLYFISQILVNIRIAAKCTMVVKCNMRADFHIPYKQAEWEQLRFMEILHQTVARGKESWWQMRAAWMWRHILAHGSTCPIRFLTSRRASWRNVVGLLSVIKQSCVREVMCGEVRDELDERRGDHFEMSNVGSFSGVVKIRLNVPCGCWSIQSVLSSSVHVMSIFTGPYVFLNSNIVDIKMVI